MQLCLNDCVKHNIHNKMLYNSLAFVENPTIIHFGMPSVQLLRPRGPVWNLKNRMPDSTSKLHYRNSMCDNNCSPDIARLHSRLARGRNMEIHGNSNLCDSMFAQTTNFIFTKTISNIPLPEGRIKPLILSP